MLLRSRRNRRGVASLEGLIANAHGNANGPMTWINAAVLVAGALILVAVLGPRLGAAADSRP